MNHQEDQRQHHFGYRPPTPRHRALLFDEGDQLSTCSSSNLQQSQAASVIASECESSNQNLRSNGDDGSIGSRMTVRDKIKMYNAASKSVSTVPRLRNRNIHVSPAKSSTSHSLFSASNNASYCPGLRNVTGSVKGNGSTIISQTPSVMDVIRNFREAEEQNNFMERCRHCNLLKRVNQVHYCYNYNSKCYRIEQSLGAKSISSHMSNTSLTSNFSKGIQPGSALKEKTCSQQPIGDDVQNVLVAGLHNSKTTIVKTPEGVRIIIDIYFDQQNKDNNPKRPIGNRIETEIPDSRILKEFQEELAQKQNTTSDSSKLSCHTPTMSLSACLMQNCGQKM